MKAKYFNQLLLIFVLCSCNYRMQERKLAFDIITEFNLPEIINPDVCATKDEIFVTNLATQTDGKIYTYNYQGDLLSEFGGKGDGPDEFTHIFNIFYDYNKNLLGIYDFYGFCIKYYNAKHELVMKDVLDKTMFNKVYTAESSLQSHLFPKDSSDKKLYYLHDLHLENGNKISLKEKEFLSSDDFSIFKESTRIAANMDFFFIWDLNGNETSVEQFDVEGNPVKKWDLKMLPRYLENIKKYNRIHAGDDFILYDFQDNNDVHFYDAYDFKNKYLGTIRMSKPEDTIPFVFKDKIFMLEYNEQDDEDFYVCKILKMK